MSIVMRTNHRPMGRPASWVSRYGLAVLSVAVALAVTRLLPSDAQIRGPVFIPAIMLSAWYGGIGPGLLATGLSVLAIDYFLLPPVASLKLFALDDAAYLVVFLLSALLVAWLTGSQRRSEEALRQARDDLAARVRDVELTNERLEAEIVERKQAEAEVRRQASLLDLTHDSIFVRDVNDVITYWNRGAAERYGWSRAEAVGSVTHDLLKTRFPAPLESITEEVYRTGHWEGELVHTRRDATPVIVASRWSVQRDERGQPVGILETNNDITERREAAQALDAARTELARVTRVTMLGEITASIAHEINQPLAAVVMNGNACRRWLAADPPNIDEARDSAQRIVSDATRAGEVIARVRALVRREASQKTALDVNDIILETLAFTRGEVERHRAALADELAEDLPPITGDRVQLQQVLVNLILNGLDAMEGVTARPRVLTIRSERSDSGHVAVEVKDSGKGIDPSQRDRIFDPFYSTKTDGLGMGLAISRSIVEQHGGTIRATANDAAGVTMRLTLPAVSGGE
jgi:two-component system sensor kinase FixL